MHFTIEPQEEEYWEAEIIKATKNCTFTTDFDETAIPVGSIAWCERTYGQLVPIYYPEFMQPYFHRTIRRAVYNDKETYKNVFMKHATAYKQPNIQCGDEIWCSDVVRFTNEWRYYVGNGRIIASAWYDGDVSDDDVCAGKVPPPPTLPRTLRRMLKSMRWCGVLDMGTMLTAEKERKFALVEACHPYAVGWYPATGDGFAEFLRMGHAYLTQPNMFTMLPTSILYDWLTTGAMASYNPGILRLVSKDTKRAIDAATETGDFWKTLMRHCFPNIAVDLPFYISRLYETRRARATITLNLAWKQFMHCMNNYFLQAYLQFYVNVSVKKKYLIFQPFFRLCTCKFMLTSQVPNVLFSKIVFFPSIQMSFYKLRTMRGITMNYGIHAHYITNADFTQCPNTFISLYEKQEFSYYFALRIRNISPEHIKTISFPFFTLPFIEDEYLDITINCYSGSVFHGSKVSFNAYFSDLHKTVQCTIYHHVIYVQLKKDGFCFTHKFLSNEVMYMRIGDLYLQLSEQVAVYQSSDEDSE